MIAGGSRESTVFDRGNFLLSTTDAKSLVLVMGDATGLLREK